MPSYPSYSAISGKYYYGDGDYYSFTAQINYWNGGGGYSPGDIIYPGTSTYDNFTYLQQTNDTNNNGYYQIETAQNYNQSLILSSEKYIKVQSYFDSDSLTWHTPEIDYFFRRHGSYGLGSESGQVEYNGTYYDFSPTQSIDIGFPKNTVPTYSPTTTQENTTQESSNEVLVEEENIFDEYKMSADKSTYNEGETIIVSFTNPDGIGSSVKIIRVTGNGVNSNDYEIQQGGTIYFLSGENKFSIQIKNDLKTEGDEIFQIKFYQTLQEKNQVGSTINVNIKDTSTNELVDNNISSSNTQNNSNTRYEISTDKISYNEGESIIIYFEDLKRIKVGDGSITLKIEGKGVDKNDFDSSIYLNLNSNLAQGSFAINLGKNAISLPLKNDQLTEGLEKLDIKFYYSEWINEEWTLVQAGETISINLNDTSTSSTINSDIVDKITRTISNTTQTYFGTSSNYKFYNLGEDRYALKTDSGYDEITGVTNLQFSDKTLSLENDIADTFDQVTGLNTDSGEMFRLYNAAFARFPDADGLKYWIDQFSSGRNTRRVVAQSFLGSAEFTEKYGSNVSDETYVNNLYKNVLGRDADAEGLNYWVGNLSSGLETRYEALLGFAESAENKALFTEMTGFG